MNASLYFLSLSFILTNTFVCSAVKLWHFHFKMISKLPFAQIALTIMFNIIIIHVNAVDYSVTRFVMIFVWHFTFCFCFCFGSMCVGIPRYYRCIFVRYGVWLHVCITEGVSYLVCVCMCSTKRIEATSGYRTKWKTTCLKLARIRSHITNIQRTHEPWE